MGTILVITCLMALAACGGSELLVTKAGSYSGGALSSFSGSDGQDAAARDMARDIATQREYDFTPTGFSLIAGPASSEGHASLDFTDGSGTLATNGNQATVTLNITSNEPTVSDVQMVGSFALNDAQQAIDSPGSSFVVEWGMTFMLDGAPISLTAVQTLAGADFQEV